MENRSGSRPRGGLRERKKLAVRRALGSAAIRLAVERGLENVTIEDITAGADVSLRTFGNYFSSKYEAMCATGTDRARRIGAELLARPAREPLWEAICAAIVAHYEGADGVPDAPWRAGLKLVLSSPATRGEYLKVTSEMQQALAEAIAARTGTDMGQDMYPQILAGAVIAATQVAVGRWAAADPPVPLRPRLQRALDQLATACAGGADRYLTEEEFKALVRPAIFGPNGPLCEPPGEIRRAAQTVMNHDKSLSSGDLVHLPGALTMSRLRGCGDVCVIAGSRCFSFVEEDVKIRYSGTAVAAVMATLLVAACGGGSSGASSAPRPSAGASTASSTPTAVGSPPAAATLVRQVNSAVANARGVHINATVTQGGSTVGLNVDMTRSNEMSGDMIYKNEPLIVLVRNGRLYIKVTAGAAKAIGLPSAACVLMCGKWLKMTASDSKSMLGDLSWSTFLSPSNPAPRLRYVRTVTVNGQPAWQMSVSTGGTAYVAARGTPYPLRMVQGPDRIDFTRWNSVVIPPLPPASQVVDLSQLENL